MAGTRERIRISASVKLMLNKCLRNTVFFQLARMPVPQMMGVFHSSGTGDSMAIPCISLMELQRVQRCVAQYIWSRWHRWQLVLGPDRLLRASSGGTPWGEDQVIFIMNHIQESIFYFQLLMWPGIWVIPTWISKRAWTRIKQTKLLSYIFTISYLNMIFLAFTEIRLSTSFKSEFT